MQKGRVGTLYKRFLKKADTPLKVNFNSIPTNTE